MAAAQRQVPGSSRRPGAASARGAGRGNGARVGDAAASMVPVSGRQPAAFGGVRESARYSKDLGGSMLLTNANRDRPYSKVPTRAGQPYYGKRSRFTDDSLAYMVAVEPKAAPSRSRSTKDLIRHRMRQVKEQIREERLRRRNVVEAHKELEERLDRTIGVRNDTVKFPQKDVMGATMPRPKGTRNGQPYYGRVWCAENRKQEVEALRPARKATVDSMFTIMHKC